jgi:hypothetical protein
VTDIKADCCARSHAFNHAYRARPPNRPRSAPPSGYCQSLSPGDVHEQLGPNSPWCRSAPASANSSQPSQCAESESYQRPWFSIYRASGLGVRMECSGHTPRPTGKGPSRKREWPVLFSGRKGSVSLRRIRTADRGCGRGTPGDLNYRPSGEHVPERQPDSLPWA